YSLLMHNNYLFFGTDGGGNSFAFDAAEPGCPIRLFDHNSYMIEEYVPELYSEILEFYFDEETTEYINPLNLDTTAIFNNEGNYKLDAAYIKDYLKSSEASREVSNYGLLPFFIGQTLQSFIDVINYYYSDVESIAENYMGT